MLWYDVIITMNDLKGVMDMSTLEKTINLLNDLPENEVEIIYSYVRFISSQHEERKKPRNRLRIFLIILLVFYRIQGKLPNNITMKGLQKNMTLLIDTNILLDMVFKRPNCEKVKKPFFH